MQDDAKLLCEYGLTAASRVLVTKGAAGAAAGGGAGSLSAEEARAAAEQARAEHLDRLRAAAAKISGRDGRGLSDKYEFSLENQVRPSWCCTCVVRACVEWPRCMRCTDGVLLPSAWCGRCSCVGAARTHCSSLTAAPRRAALRQLQPCRAGWRAAGAERV